MSSNKPGSWWVTIWSSASHQYMLTGDTTSIIISLPGKNHPLRIIHVYRPGCSNINCKWTWIGLPYSFFIFIVLLYSRFKLWNCLEYDEWDDIINYTYSVHVNYTQTLYLWNHSFLLAMLWKSGQFWCNQHFTSSISNYCLICPYDFLEIHLHCNVICMCTGP